MKKEEYDNFNIVLRYYKKIKEQLLKINEKELKNGLNKELKNSFNNLDKTLGKIDSYLISNISEILFHKEDHAKLVISEMKNSFLKEGLLKQLPR